MEAEIMFQPSLPSHPQKLQHLSQQGLPTPSALSSPLRSVESLFLGPVKKPHVSIQKHQVDHVGNCWVVQDKWWVEYVTFIYIDVRKNAHQKHNKLCVSMYQYISTYIQVPSQEIYQAKIPGSYRWDKDMEMYTFFGQNS